MNNNGRYNGSEMKLGLFVIWSAECVKKTDFGQFMIIKFVK